MTVRSYGLDTDFGYESVQFDLGLRDTTLGQGYSKSLGHGQQLCEILSRSNLTVRSYGPTQILGISAL